MAPKPSCFETSNTTLLTISYIEVDNKSNYKDGLDLLEEERELT
jgi:hypothetical protein